TRDGSSPSRAVPTRERDAAKAGELRRRPAEISHLLAELLHLLADLRGLGELLGCKDVADRERDRQALLGHLMAVLVGWRQVGRRWRGGAVRLVDGLLACLMDQRGV